MVPFHLVFPEIGDDETRTLFALPGKGADRPGDLPADGYVFVEYYCDEPDCDCRRVVFIVTSIRTEQKLATINHAFEPPGPDEHVREQTFLDPLHPQSEHAGQIMDMLQDVLLSDAAYVERLHRHYAMVKKAARDPGHAIHRLGRDWGPSGRPRKTFPGIPPPRRKRRKR